MLFRSALLAILLAPFSAFGADSSLLGLVMPDVKVVSGIQVNQAKSSPFGKYLLSRMQPSGTDFQTFVNQTGFDPRRDLTEIIMASSWANSPSRQVLVVARGSFTASKLKSAIELNGGTATPFKGIDILMPKSKSAGNANSVFAVLDTNYATMGDLDAVQTVIQRFQNKAVAPASLVSKVNTLSAANDFWFMTLVPVSDFTSVVPDPNMGQMMNGNVMQSIQQLSGGIKFGPSVQLSAQAVTRSEKDATALEDVVRFFVSLLQSNRDKNPAAAQASSLADNLELSSDGNVMAMSLAVPEDQLESLFNTARQSRKPPLSPQ
jgi:hypothetical protein